MAKRSGLFGSENVVSISIGIASGVVFLVVGIGILLTLVNGLTLELQAPGMASEEAARAFGERLGRFIGAGLALGLAAVGAGIAVGVAGAAGISAFTEKPEVFGRVFLIIVLGEGLAIYGIAIAILILILGVA